MEDHGLKRFAFQVQCLHEDGLDNIAGPRCVVCVARVRETQIMPEGEAQAQWWSWALIHRRGLDQEGRWDK